MVYSMHMYKPTWYAMHVYVQPSNTRCSIWNQCQIKHVEQIILQLLWMKARNSNPWVWPAKLCDEAVNVTYCVSMGCTWTKVGVQVPGTPKSRSTAAPAHLLRNPRDLHVKSLLNCFLISTMAYYDAPVAICYELPPFSFLSSSSSDQGPWWNHRPHCSSV
jgi:hypothetical protein